MNKSHLFLFFVGLFISSLQANDTLNLPLLRTIQDGTEISIGIYENGEIYKQGYFLKDGELIPKENASALFEVGSLTKTFTTAAALKVLDRKGIAVDGNISAYLPEDTFDESHNVTFSNLMTHTSGLPELPTNIYRSAIKKPSDPVANYNMKMSKKALQKHDSKKNPPNKKFNYSNVGMGVLGYISSSLENMTYTELIQKEIFNPMQLNDTSIGISPDKYQRVAYRKIKNNGKPKHLWSFDDITAGAGAAYSCVNDLLIYMDKVIHKSSADALLNEVWSVMEESRFAINPKKTTGFGWRIRPTKNTVHYHGGTTFGFKTIFAYDKENKRGVIILTNAKTLNEETNDIINQVAFEYLDAW